MSEHYEAQLKRQLAEARERAAKAEAELAALHAGEEPYEDDRLIPTPVQWIWQWNRETPEKRLAMAALVLERQERLNHYTWTERIQLHDRAEQAEARIAAVRALHRDDYGLCTACTSSHGIPWPCPTIAALDGTATTATPVPALIAAEDRLHAAEARLAAIRIVLDRYLGCASDEAAVLRAEVKAALDGPAVRPRCCVCGTTEHGGRTYENHRGQLFCIPCADGNRPSCPLGDGCHGVNCPQAANHGPRTAGSPS